MSSSNSRQPTAHQHATRILRVCRLDPPRVAPAIGMLGARRRWHLARLALLRAVSRPDIVRSGASRRRHALPRPALLRPHRAIGVLEQPVWTLALGFKLRGVQCSRFRYPFNELGLI